MVRTILAPLLGCALLLGARWDPPAEAAPGDDTIVLTLDGKTRAAWFVLEEERADETGEKHLHAVGTLCLRRRSDRHGLSLEAEVRFPAVDSRVLLTEETGPLSRRLVYREFGGANGRSLLLEELPGAGFELVEWGGPRRRTSRIAPVRDLLFPLELADLVHTRDGVPHEVEVFDPLSARPMRVRVDLRDLVDEDGPFRRLVLLRDDGTLVGSYVVRAGELVELAWQRGGTRGRRVEAEEAARIERALRPTGTR